MVYRTKQKQLIKKILTCTVCDTQREIVRSRAKNREAGHNKKMFCAACKKPTLHEEL